MVSNKRLKVGEVLAVIKTQKLTLFTPKIFAKFFKVSLPKTSIFLSRNTRLGYFVRIKKGIYSPKDFQPSSLEVANLIYRPSYISLEMALSFYHIIPETVYGITSITTKHSKEIKALNQNFRYHKISKKLYFGYRAISIGNKNVILATKEKALLDYLYFVAIGQKKYNERFDLRVIDKKKLYKYADVFFKNIKNKYVRKNFGLLLSKINL